MHRFISSTNFFSVIFILILFLGCSASETVIQSESPEKADNRFPAWYSQNTFVEDSLSFTALGSAVHSDSIKAGDLAIDKANEEMIFSLGKKIEEWRKQSVEDGQTALKENDFLIFIRNTERSLSNKTTVSEKTVRKMDGLFYGFSSVQLQKSVLNTTMSESLESRDISWKGF